MGLSITSSSLDVDSHSAAVWFLLSTETWLSDAACLQTDAFPEKLDEAGRCSSIAALVCIPSTWKSVASLLGIFLSMPKILESSLPVDPMWTVSLLKQLLTLWS